MSSKQLKVKVVLGEDIRRWRYPEDVSSRYLDLGKFINKAFNLSQFTLKYEDDENDHITMSNQRDFEDAFQAALEENRRSLKIFVIPADKTDDKKPTEKEEKLDEPEEEDEQVDCASLRALALDFISNEEIVALLPLAFTNIVKALKNCDLKQVKLDELILNVLKSDAGFNPITQHKLFAHGVKFLPCICARAKQYIPFIINDSTNEAAIMSFLPQMINLLRMGLLRFENINFDIELDGRKVNVGSFIPDWFAFESNNDNKKEDDEKVHKGVTCDGCNKSPITGVRYKCSICEDFDLCGDCEAAGKHNPSHPMLKFYLNQQFHHSLFRGLHEVMKRNGLPPFPHFMHCPPPPQCFAGFRRGGHMHHNHFNHHGRGGPNFHQKRDFAHRRHGRHHRHNRCGGGYKGRKWNVNIPQDNNDKKNVEENEDKARTDAMIRLAESNCKNTEPAKKEQEKSLIALEKDIINEENDEIKKDEEEEEIVDNKSPIFCLCGEILIELNGRNVICDICNKRCNRSEKVYHCPKDNGSDLHRRGYDLCLSCGDIQRISLMEISNKAKEVNKEEKIEVEKKEENEEIVEEAAEEVVSDIEVEIIPGDNIPANEIDIYGDETDDEDNDDVPPPISSCITVVDMDESDENEPEEEEQQQEEVIEEVAEAQVEDDKAEKKDDFAYNEQLNMLAEMGFEKNDAIYALLVQKNGNVQEVITQLLR